jgi:hypothetical protein
MGKLIYKTVRQRIKSDICKRWRTSTNSDNRLSAYISSTVMDDMDHELTEEFIRGLHPMHYLVRLNIRKELNLSDGGLFYDTTLHYIDWDGWRR